MENTGLHPGLEKMEEFGEIEDLEGRYKLLADRLRALNGEGPGFRPDMKAELEKVADDLSGTVDDFVSWVDSGYRRDQRPNRFNKS